MNNKNEIDTNIINDRVKQQLLSIKNFTELAISENDVNICSKCVRIDIHLSKTDKQLNTCRNITLNIIADNMFKGIINTIQYKNE